MSEPPRPPSKAESDVTTTGREEEYEEEDEDEEEEEGEMRECEGGEDDVVVDDCVKHLAMEADGGVTTSSDARPSEAGECGCGCGWVLM